MKKRTILLTTLLLATIFTFGQNTPSVWTHKANNGGNDFMVTDGNQNVYLFDSGSQGAATPHVIKLNSTGQAVFNNGYLPVGYTSMNFNSAVFKGGNIYFASTVSDGTLNNRLCLTSINTSGILINQIVIDSIAVNTLMNQQSGAYSSYGISVDNSNNLHVSFSKSDSTFFQYFSFLKLDLNFNLLAHYDEPVGYVNSIGQVDYNVDGSVYFSYSGVVCKLKSDYSSLAWTAPVTDQYMFPLAISNDGSNNVYATFSDIANSTGTHLYRFVDGGNSFTPTYDIVCCSNPAFELTRLNDQSSTNCVYVAGYKNSTQPQNLHMKIEASTGNILWTDTVLNGYFVRDIFITSVGNLISVGGGPDYNVWLFDSFGNVDRTILYDGLFNCNDQITGAVLLSPTSLAVTGYACENANTIAWGTTLLYNIPLITTEVGTDAPASVLDVFPNPVGSRLAINIKEEIKTMVVFNSLWQSISLPMLSNNELDVSSLKSGIYVLSATTAQGSYLKKFVVGP